MAIGIKPTVDYSFKRIPGNPENVEITLHFVNAVLGDAYQIVSLSFGNPIIGKEFEEDKNPVLDIVAVDDRGRIINIEMQTTTPANLAMRLVYYASCLFTGQVHEGQSYDVIRPVVSICVLEQAFFRNADELHLEFKLRDARHGLVLMDELQVHLLQLSKYNLHRERLAAATALEKWAYFLRYAAEMDAAEIAHLLGHRVFDKAAGVLEMIAKTPSERFLYDAREKALKDELWRAQDAEIRVERATAEALAKGRAEGRAEGWQFGEVAGEIRGLQLALGLPRSTTEELSAMDVAQLKELAAQLERRLQSPR